MHARVSVFRPHCLMYPRAEVGFHFPAQVLVCLALAALAWAEGPAPGLPPDAFSPAPPATTSPESPGDAPVEAPTASPPPHAPGNEWADEASPAPGSEAANEPEPAPPGTPLRLPAGNAVRHDDIQITASVDNSRPSIGDWVTYRLRAEGPEGIELRRAEIPEKMPDYLALKGRLASESRTENGRVSRTWEFLLDFYFSGQFPLPPIVVTYRGLDGTEKQVIAPLFLLDIQGLQLDPAHPADIRPNKPMRDIP
ncbi:MAG: hypothetical protein HYZ27_03900, partial [Deltaproteobacteria bacterium]|nr:hypothetical protein [Deltaproteobacteria bacterium]